MEIFKDSEKIGKLQGVQIKGLEIEGLWINHFEPIDMQTDPYTLKNGNEIYEECWLSHSRGSSNGLIVKFLAARKKMVHL